MLNELVKLLHTFFATDQGYHAEQQTDGTYRKKLGIITPQFLEKNLKQFGSMAIYQKNTDQTIKWICFDFDILKKNLVGDKIEKAHIELKRAVLFFCQSLNEIKIPYLLEFSGNRGFHIWITFKEKTSYRIGYDIQRAILEKIDLQFNKELIAIDLFPHSGTPTSGVGIGVKIPLSKHTKSGQYSLLLSSPYEIESYPIENKINDEIIKKHVDILNTHLSTSKSEIESRLGVFFELSHDEFSCTTRIKSIKVSNKGFTLQNLIEHWENYLPLKTLGKKIVEANNLNNEERKLLVGLFGNIQRINHPEFNKNILHELFKKTENYNKEITQKAIKSLSSFYFPSQEQIEITIGIKFEKTFTIDELLRACIPKYVEYEDATFDLSRKDIEITKIAELNYLFLNDEAHSKIVINELSGCDSDELLIKAKNLLKEPKKAKHYKHIRNEGTKLRKLATLKTSERIITSCIIKQIIYFFDMQPSSNSHGYKPSNGFKGGYIFHPWLYSWIKFISNISSAIEDKNNLDYYIVKTDIKSFYDRIPHDNLKRILLGDGNIRIEQRLNELAENQKSLYTSYIDTIFEITETITNSKIGLPQGPAYARYLAELYLDNIDQILDEKIKSEKVYLYQRYVDDIFFVVSSEEIAKETLEELKNDLQLLGLEVNMDKTIISRIRNFSEDFNAYRSQSKYVVDKVSKNFADATEIPKNLAINEFMTLVQSDSCDDDLAFIFSHLNGVPQLDQWKREKVIPVLQSGVGRGTLYKHLFNFVLEDENNWKILYEIEKFTELQSEVLTSAFINALETSKLNIKSLNKLIECLVQKLTISELVGEHLIYLSVTFETKIILKNIPPKTIINCLKSVSNVENIKITSEIVEYLNTTLNDIKSLPDFVKAIYPLCASSCLSKEDLNNLASTFYAKISNDKTNDNLSVDKKPKINTSATASKFYYLLCLFSISNKNKSTDLLQAAWKYCAYIFNIHDEEVNSSILLNSFEKITDIEVDEPKALWIISSIIDGNIFRGLENGDTKKVFERFHNILLIHIAFKTIIHTLDINKELELLKEKAIFYQWLIDRMQVRLFPPSNKTWFEKNIIENSSIILIKENEILFRKPTSDFHHTSLPKNEHNGYSEIIINYVPENLVSLKDSLTGLTVKQRLIKLLEIIKYCDNADNYPNIYCNEKILNKSSLLPFSNELMKSNYLIYENHDGYVESLWNNQKNFIACFLKTPMLETNATHFRMLSEKYINNLDTDIDLLEFIKHICTQLDGLEDPFYYDIAVAAALFLSLKDFDPYRRIDKFVNQYHKFNHSVEERYIYGVKNDTKLLDETPMRLLETVEKSLKLIPTEAMQSLAFYLDKDIESYKNCLKKIAALHNADIPPLDLNDFQKAYHKIFSLSETININGVDYKFENIKLINVINNNLQQFDSCHAIILNSSEHIYFLVQNSTVFIVAIQSSISKIYLSVKKRHEHLISEGKSTSYPENIVDKKEILSLSSFDLAADNIAIHRDISKQDAEQILTKWLRFLPKKFHQPLTTLISAHEVMKKNEIDEFIGKVALLLKDKSSNPFLIKRIGDSNGTHRILYKDHDIGRNLENLAPLNISEGAIKATIIADCIITGSQIKSAIEFYVTGDKKKNDKYFEYTSDENDIVIERLKALKLIEICTVLYTEKALENIKNNCRKILNTDIEISIICGRKIGDDAFFGKTTKIGDDEKSTIRDILKNEDVIRTLLNHLDYKHITNYSDDEIINKTNLVARYQSLPKKCFNFLHFGLKHDSSCHPLVRVFEVNE